MVKVDQTVRVRGGPFDGFTGEVRAINEVSGIAVVLVSIFGRDTAVEAPIDALEDAPEVRRRATVDRADPTSILDEDY